MKDEDLFSPASKDRVLGTFWGRAACSDVPTNRRCVPVAGCAPCPRCLQGWCLLPFLRAKWDMQKS